MAGRIWVTMLLGVGLGLLAVAAIAYAPANRSGGAPYLALFGGGPNKGGSVPTMSTGGTGTLTVSPGSATGSEYGKEVSSGTQGLPSLIANIGKQPPSQSAVLFLPVIAAVLFGVVIYRAASQRSEDGASAGD